MGADWCARARLHVCTLRSYYVKVNNTYVYVCTNLPRPPTQFELPITSWSSLPQHPENLILIVTISFDDTVRRRCSMARSRLFDG